jgi:hypothetical protein
MKNATWRRINFALKKKRAKTREIKYPSATNGNQIKKDLSND